MMKINLHSRVTKVICLFVIAICCLVSGLIFSHLANANKGIAGGIMTNGEVVETNYYGGNAKKEKKCRSIANVSYAFSGIFFVGGVVYLVKPKK